jgi:hypothetical protein
MDSERPTDSVQFWVRFLCGAIFGSILGFMLWFWVLPGTEFPWIGVPFVVLAFGFVAAWWGDRFWYVLLRCFRWL